MLACNGMGADGDHCCYVGGKVCDYLRFDHPERKYACGLMMKYGSWGAMNASPEYQDIGEHWLATDNPFNYCETFDPGFCCRPEGRLGRANDRQPIPITIEGVT